MPPKTRDKRKQPSGAQKSKTQVLNLSAAHLPPIGLPKQWESGGWGDGTAARQMNTLYEPSPHGQSGVYYALDGNPIIVPGKDDKPKQRSGNIGFIESTKKGDEPQHHSVTTARVAQLRKAGLILKGAGGEEMIPCLRDGGYITIRSMDADHAHAKATILARQKELISKLNAKPPEGPAFVNQIIAESGGQDKFDQLFKWNPTVNPPRYMGTEAKSNLKCDSPQGL